MENKNIECSEYMSSYNKLERELLIADHYDDFETIERIKEKVLSEKELKIGVYYNKAKGIRDIYYFEEFGGEIIGKKEDRVYNFYEEVDYENLSGYKLTKYDYMYEYQESLFMELITSGRMEEYLETFNNNVKEYKKNTYEKLSKEIKLEDFDTEEQRENRIQEILREYVSSYIR